MDALTDKFGRKHDYLRISVTDQCNLRCLYCMPEEGMVFMDQDKLLRFEQIVEVVRTAAKLGVKKLRITGGEPLIRPGLDLLIAELAAIPGIVDISLTTNGILLGKYAQKLKKAGLHRVNISLDTLEPAKFRMIARRGELNKVLEGIEAAVQAGFDPIKLNMVLLRGMNDNEISAFLLMSRDRPLHIRFIEYMPIGHDDEGWRSHYLPLSAVLDAANAMNLRTERLNDADIVGNGPSENYKIVDGAGSFGLIHPVSDRFCESCNRLRLTAEGHIKPCLYWVDELDVKPCLGDEPAMIQLFQQAMGVKPQNHEMAAKLWNETLNHTPTSRRMSQIGG